MKTKIEITIESPAVAGVAQAIGLLSLVIGIAMIVFAIASIGSFNRSAGDASFVFVAFTLPFSSLLWFALARAIILLAQIAHNSSEATKTLALMNEEVKRAAK